MKRIFAVLLLSAVSAIAQGSFGRGLLANRPVVCEPGDQYFATDNQTPYICASRNSWNQLNTGGGGGNLTLQDNAGSTVGSRAILQILNGTYLTCALADTGTKLTQQCDANTVKLVDRTQANTWTAGAKQIFQVSGTTEGLNLAPAALPSAAAAGALAVDATNTLNLFDGSGWNKAVTTTTTLTSGAPIVGAGTNKVALGTTTGTGNFVLSSSPTISLPVITDFSNAGHDHHNVANGGQLSNTAILAANLQGNGTKFLMAGTVSGTAATLCTDASGNATTTGCSSGAAYGGATVYTTSHTIGASDIGKLVVMNCTAACTVTFESAPAATDWWGVESIGSTVAAISLNGKTYNGSASVPALNSYRDLRVASDGANYFGDAPLVAGSLITITPSSNGVTIGSGTTEVKTTIAFSQLTAAATTQDINLFTIPANSIITAVVIRHTTAFSGGNLTDLTVSIGRTGASQFQDYSVPFDIFTASSTTNFFMDGGAISKDQASHIVNAHFTGTFSSGNFSTNGPTVGSVTIWIRYTTLG